MRGVTNSIFAILLCAWQTTVFDKIDFFGTRPNLLLAFTVCVALLYGSVEGGGIGLLCGVMTDVMGYGAFGINSLMLMYIGIGVGLVSKRFYRIEGIVAFAFSFASTFTYGIVYFFFAFFIWGNGSMWFAFSRRILPESIYTSFMAVLLVIMLKHINNRFFVREA